MITKEMLISDGFILKTYPDGNFWLRYSSGTVFLQVDEDLTNITLCYDGWVEDNLTYEEYKLLVEQFNSK